MAWEALAADYASYHTTRGNRLCHAVGIPLIVLALARWSQVEALGPVPLVALLLPVYFFWGVGLGLGMMLFLGLLSAAALLLTPWIALAAFVLGWVFQGVGHLVFERRQAAFQKNLVHLLVGPAWILRELTGWRALLVLLLSAPAFAQPAKVEVGVHVNDVHDLDLKTHSYGADLYVWLRWTDPALDPAATLEFANPFETWSQTRQLDHEKPVREGGVSRQVVRVNGRFSRKLRLDHYPFDRQVLVVEFEDHRLGADRLVYEPVEVTLNPSLELPGFLIGTPSLRAEARRYPTAFGEKSGQAYSRARLELPIVRPRLTYAAKLLVPILCVVLCAALMFLFHPKYVDSRVGIGITALLTVVALQITLNDELPEISYLVLMDKVYLGAYLFMLSGLGVVVRTTWLIERGNVARAIQFDRRALAVLLSLYLAATAALVLPRL